MIHLGSHASLLPTHDRISVIFFFFLLTYYSVWKVKSHSFCTFCRFLLVYFIALLKAIYLSLVEPELNHSWFMINFLKISLQGSFQQSSVFLINIFQRFLSVCSSVLTWQFWQFHMMDSSSAAQSLSNSFYKPQSELYWVTLNFNLYPPPPTLIV